MVTNFIIIIISSSIDIISIIILKWETKWSQYYEEVFQK